MSCKKLFFTLGCAVATLFAPSLPAAGDFGWTDLIDMSAQDFEDPYRDLSYEQIDGLRTIFATRQKLAPDNLTAEERDRLEAELLRVQAMLAAAGIDADRLISQRWVVAEQRKRAATAGNPEVDGQTIQLSGFALAGPPAEDGTPVAYLVPERGMCSHMPPPDPNQMIRVRLNGNWSPSYAHEPVRLTGRISITPTDTVFHVVDGPVQMRATFLMEAEKVETIREMRAQADAEATREWAQKIIERLRASGVTLHSSMKQSE